MRDAKKRNNKIPDGRYFPYKKRYDGKWTEDCDLKKLKKMKKG
jgi:hypothetical protein